jgi:hypothetical protein
MKNKTEQRKNKINEQHINTLRKLEATLIYRDID